MATMKIALALVALTALCQAYDFKDEIYNQLIKQDLDDLESYQETYINYRRKREETKGTTPKSEDSQPSPDKCKRKRFRMCCGEDIVDSIFEKDKELKKECYKDVTGRDKDDKLFGSYDPFNCEKVNKTKKEWSCVMQCVGQKKNVVDANGNIKEKEALEYYKKEFANEPWFLKLVEAAFPKCAEQAKNVTGFVKNKEDPLSCSPVGMKMHHCMWREIQLTCPEDKITDQKMCSRIREKIKKHDDVSFKHLPHVHDDE